MKIPKKLTVADFTNSPKLLAHLQQLKTRFGNQGENLVISDTMDGAGHQYVNLVQKGGGVLGVALVGYTYVLEQMGIRFLRLAGTSAGAINTAMLAVIGQKEDAKSVPVLEAISQLDFFNLVDGHPAARWLIKNFITHKGFVKKLRNWGIGILVFYFLLLMGSFICLWLVPHNGSMIHFTQTLVVILVITTLLLGDGIWYIRKLLKRLKTSGYGINPGDYFLKWMESRMAENGVHTVEDLNKKARQPISGLRLRYDHPDGLNGLEPDITLIASELITENKIEFPRMCSLFRPPDRIQELSPAGFVRASMSIPVFFESYFIYDIPHQDPAVKAAWMESFGKKDPPQNARFVDGGILSNFPVSIFYNPRVSVPRLPLFGIELDDSKPGDEGKNADKWSFAGYFFRIFNTIRNYYDKDFQLKNKVYSRGIGSIPLQEFNWLNFFLTDREKLTMFEKGAEAATQFLLNFDWEAYKSARTTMQATIESKKDSVPTAPPA